MGPDRSINVEAAPADDVVYCARHPQVETALRCGRCDTPICPRCLVQTSVGSRCRTCAGVTAIPTFNLTPLLLVRGLGAAVGTGLVVGAAWAVLLGASGIPFMSFFLGLGLGWLISECISYATNRRTGPPLAVMGVLSAFISYFTRNIVLGAPLIIQGDLSGYIIAGVAAVFAYSRLNR